MGVVAIDDSEAGHAVGCGHCGSIILVPQSRVSPGAIIDDFVIEKEVGQGGLATVYQAHQISLDRPAALKVLRDQYASNRSYIADFIKEARAAAQINHPNIVTAYAVGDEDDIHYFAMEFVQGETLKHVLGHSGRLFPDKAMDITRVIAEALEFAWQKKQLVHLDIKPDNIILTESREYKLADLGLARLGGDIRDQTDTCEVFGTPQYISPEVLTGSPTDNRTDIYSLGATLYHAVTGRHPFEGKTASEIARKHITDRLVPACEVAKDIPRAVSDLIDIMMAKRPGHRWQSAGEVVEQIDRIKADKPLSRRPNSQLQKPLNLEIIAEEFKATVEDLDDENAGQNAAQGNLRRAGSTTLRKKGGAVTLRTKGGGTRRAQKGKKTDTPGTEGDRRAKRSGLTIKAGGKKNTFKKRAGSTSSAAAGDSQNNADTPPIKKRKKKKMSVGAILGCFGAFFVVMTLLSVIVIVVLSKHKKQKEYEDRIAKMGLSIPQYEKLNDFQAKIKIGVDDTTVLAEADKLLRTYADSKAMTSYVRRDVAPIAERELRGLRLDQRQKEILSWRDRSRELQEKARLGALQAEKRRIAAAKARAEQERQDRLRHQREALVRALQDEKPDVRQQAVEQCRKMNFEVAKVALSRFANAPDADLAQWGKNWQQAIDLGSEAFEFIRNGEKYLLGERLAVKGRAQGFSITGIQPQSIAAEYREKIYNRGIYTGRENDKVENVSVSYSDVRVTQLIKLMETSGLKQDMAKPAIQLRIGAFLYVTGSSPALVKKYLQDAGTSEVTEAMLRDL